MYVSLDLKTVAYSNTVIVTKISNSVVNIVDITMTLCSIMCLTLFLMLP